jgi:hypothetical protein
VNGRRKGLDAERKAVALLRSFYLRAMRTERERDDRRSNGTGDVDAVILRRGRPAIEVQIKREDPPRLAEWTRRYVGPDRVLMYRANGGRWTVVVYEERAELCDPGQPYARRSLDVEDFAACVHGGLL